VKRSRGCSVITLTHEIHARGTAARRPPRSRELRELSGGKGVLSRAPIIAYCRIGERSAHTWFVLHKLLGERDVKNYDGSWTEWGNLVNVPIERG
jgi:thiosulfate/3-mercaptopyruvate sulfurtransferase